MSHDVYYGKIRNFYMEFLRNFSLIIVLFLTTALSIIWLMLCRNKLNIKWYITIPLGVIHTLCGVFCVKGFAFIESLGKNSSGMSLYGALFLLPIFYVIGAKLTKRRFADVFDTFAVCMILTLAIVRVNCIFTGCCYGLPFFGVEGFRWPTREIEIVFNVIFVSIIIPKVIKNKSNGEIFPIYMMSYGAFRFFCEFFRYNSTGYLIHIGHIWSVISFIIGLSIYSEIKSKKMNRISKKKRME